LSLLVAALLVVGLTLSRSTRGRADFTFLNGTEPKTLDPHLATGEPEHRLTEALFEGLARLDSRSLEPAPGVAESWDITPDGKTYTFHLRDNARWSDGRRVTADDFTYAWRRLQEPETGAEYAYIMHMVRYAEAYNTYRAQADALQGPVLAALDELLARYPNGVPKNALRDFDKQQNLHSILKGTPNPKLRAFLLRADQDAKTTELAELGPELQSEGARRLRLNQEARRRFGVDGGIYAKGPRTVVVELVAPAPYFLELTAFYTFYPVPRQAVERSSRDWFLPGKIVGNGPYTLAAWRVGDRISLDRSETYWGKGEVKLSHIDALAIENLTTALNLYLTGELDWLPNGYYPQELGPDLRGRADFYAGPALIAYYYRINCTRKPFDDKRVRKALNLAIDREQIAKNVMLMGQTPATHTVPPGIRGYESPETAIHYDVAEARRLLAEAGFPNGEGFPKFGILYNTQEQHKKIAEVIADQLRRNLNVNAVAYNQEWQSYLEATRSMSYDVARFGWVGDYEDPNTFLDLWQTNGGNNRTGWGSVVYDRLLEAAGDVDGFVEAPDFVLEHARDAGKLKELAQRVRESADAPARLAAMAKLRMALFAEAEGILVRDEFPVIPLYFYVVGGLVKPFVKEFYSEVHSADGTRRPNFRDMHPLRDLSVERRGR